LAEEVQKVIESFVDKVKAGSKVSLQYKPVKKKDFLKEILEKEGKVFTEEGIMDKEEAKRRGLKAIG
jgi:hypothetical protein